MLPFGGDQVLSVILSKMTPLASDDKITDPEIPAQHPAEAERKPVPPVRTMRLLSRLTIRARPDGKTKDWLAAQIGYASGCHRRAGPLCGEMPG